MYDPSSVRKRDTILLRCASKRPLGATTAREVEGRQNKEQRNLVGVDRAERERETDSSAVASGHRIWLHLVSLLRRRKCSVDNRYDFEFRAEREINALTNNGVQRGRMSGQTENDRTPFQIETCIPNAHFPACGSIALEIGSVHTLHERLPSASSLNHFGRGNLVRNFPFKGQCVTVIFN